MAWPKNFCTDGTDRTRYAGKLSLIILFLNIRVILNSCILFAILCIEIE
jgi:hypothetical protein